MGRYVLSVKKKVVSGAPEIKKYQVRNKYANGVFRSTSETHIFILQGFFSCGKTHLGKKSKTKSTKV